MPDISKTIGGLRIGPPETVGELEIELPRGVKWSFVRHEDLTEDDER